MTQFNFIFIAGGITFNFYLQEIKNGKEKGKFIKVFLIHLNSCKRQTTYHPHSTFIYLPSSLPPRLFYEKRNDRRENEMIFLWKMSKIAAI